MEKLKPCPFCGGTNILVDEIPPHKHIMVKLPDYPGSATVECADCEAALIRRTRAEVVEAWNKRAGEVFHFDLPKCQCCGKPIGHLMVDMFDREGDDSFVKTELTYIKDSDCVTISTTPNWTGYDLDDEERKETIVCPECGKYPFAPDIAIDFSEPVDVMMWLSDDPDSEKVVPEDA